MRTQTEKDKDRDLEIFREQAEKAGIENNKTFFERLGLDK